MHPKFLDILCCPKTGADLRLRADEVLDDGTVKSGALTTESGEHTYPIIGGVPRFVDREVYAQSFGYEWRKWSRVQFESENVGGPMAGHTERMFDAITGFSEEFLAGKLVVEFGCGPGRFLDVVRRRGGRAVGIDMSMAVEPARENFRGDPDVLIVQGDVLNPPFKQGSFDAGYSIGVLHHTPDPAGGFERLSAVVKERGRVACCVYPKEGLYNYPAVAAYRKIHNAVKPLVGNKLALGYAYFSAYVLYPCFTLLRRRHRGRLLADYLESRLLVNANIPDVRWRVLDVFDAITPLYASTHTAEEVRSWFVRANCRDACQMPWGATVWVGTKGGE
ncbi:MAG TPA: methyltransferase domain-containing protein [Pyrinomonadaceae bacterium]|nr:methyltransferase domain-containing protein [Pyrinomonadaceae bacterium]